jgi:serine/threonine protein kinase
MSQPASDADRPTSRLDQLIHEYLQQVDEGKSPDRAAMLREHPDLADEMAGFFDDQDRIANFAQRLRLEETVVLPSNGDKNPPAPNAAVGGGLPSSVRYFGRYEILQEIARGGMGVIYKARQSRLDRVVALKMILAGQLASTADVSRFYGEAQAAANLEHPGIVPIYEVGQYGGQHYFSMAYVDGESLAASLAAGPMLQREAAALVQQLCEAVQYAHQRGVIHRDLKPGNVLIDRDGRPRITDFGLAKQTAVASDLTATGQVLGTPSYMPPEQAAGDLAAVGPSADIYSLGAVLYAALTGRPPFQAATPIDTLLQVRYADPVSPRLVNPAVKKDLETICLKCLEKEPQRRYASAADVAEDLRRFLHDEPILARRAGLITQGARWLRKRRKTVLAIVASAAIAATLLIGAFLISQSHERSLLGNLQLSTNGPGLVAEVLDKDGHPVVPSFPVPTSQPVALPAGSYHARLSSPGIVSETYALAVDRGASLNFETRLEDRFLWPPLELKPDEFVEPVQFGKRTDLVVYRTSNRSLRRLDGATGKPIWPQDLVLDKNNLPADDSPDEWPTLLSSNTNPWQSSWLAASTVDLNHDGDADLIFASRQKPALIAASGKTGKILWLFRGRTKLSGRDDLADLPPLYREAEAGPVIGRPIVEQNGDEDATIVACFSSPGETFKTKDGKYVTADDQNWLEAVSVKTGRSIWRYPLKKDATPIQYWARLPAALEAIGQPQIAKIGGQQVVVSASNKTLYGVDLATGKEAWSPLDLGFELDSAPRIVDLQGNGHPIALFISGRPRNPSIHSSMPVTLTLTAISLVDRRQLYQTTISRVRLDTNTFPPLNDPPEFEIEPLGPHDEPTAIAPIWRTDPNAVKQTTFEFGQTELAAFDIATGKMRWEKPLNRSASFESTRVRWLTGPDLDGDGYREIFVAWIGNNQRGASNLTVAAFSGVDGRTLWRWTQSGMNEGNDPQNSMCWWQPAANGWPQLVVPVAHGPGGQAATYILDSGDGRLLRTLSEVSDPRTADLDDDGLADLFYTVAPQGYGRLMAVRGAPPTAWRRLDPQTLHVAQDFDGDGVADVTTSNAAEDTTALSGIDGRVLWRMRTRRPLAPPIPISALLPIGSGSASRPAVVALDYTAGASNLLDVAAYSALDGRRVWPAPGVAGAQVPATGVQTGNFGFRSYVYPALGTCKLDPKRVDVWASGSVNGSTNTQGYSMVALNIVSGDTGRLRWKTEVAFGLFGENGQVFQDEFQDLDGDGIADIVAWAPPADKAATAWELKAFSGADGKSLWGDAPPVAGPAANGPPELPVVGDLDKSGAPAILFVRQKQYDAKLQGISSELVAVEGRSGRVQWTWPWVNSGPVFLPPLLIDFDGSGRHSVCLLITEVTINGTATIFRPLILILDGAGKVRRRVEFKGESNPGIAQFWNGRTWWRTVAVGHGKEGLLFYDSDAIQALGGKRVESLWKWRLPDDIARVLEVLPANKTIPATIALWSGKSIYGISSESGQTRWRGEMPTPPPIQQIGTPERVLLEDRNGAGLPRLLTSDGCRLTWPVDADGRYKPPSGNPKDYDAVPDPISLRPLPWTFATGDVPKLLQIIVWTLLWFVVPFALLRWAMKRRSWRLAFLPPLYQIANVWILKIIPADWNLSIGPSPFQKLDPHVGIAMVSGVLLLVHFIWASRRRLWAIVDASALYVVAIAMAWSQRGADVTDNLLQTNTSGMFLLLVIGVPTIAAVALPAIWIWRGRWGRLGLFLAAAVAISAIQAVWLVRMDQDRLQVDEQYSLDGWYFIFAAGLFWTALLTLLGLLLKQAFRACVWTVSRVRRCFAARRD